MAWDLAERNEQRFLIQVHLRERCEERPAMAWDPSGAGAGRSAMGVRPSGPERPAYGARSAWTLVHHDGSATSPRSGHASEEPTSYTARMPIPAPMRTALTVESWVALEEDVEGELVDGRLAEEEVPSWEHEVVVAWLMHVLRAWVRPRGGFVLGSETKLVIAPGRGRKPDVVAFFGGRARHGSPAHLPPDIVVEVITATPRDQRRDRVEKKADYAALGVGQYWLVDPVARTLEILVHHASGCFLEVLAAAEGTHEVPGCEGLRIDLDALWNEVDHGAAFFTDEVTDSGS